jgi:hypothetical protein
MLTVYDPGASVPGTGMEAVEALLPAVKEEVPEDTLLSVELVGVPVVPEVGVLMVKSQSHVGHTHHSAATDSRLARSSAPQPTDRGTYKFGAAVPAVRKQDAKELRCRTSVRSPTQPASLSTAQAIFLSPTPVTTASSRSPRPEHPR